MRFICCVVLAKVYKLLFTVRFLSFFVFLLFNFILTWLLFYRFCLFYYLVGYEIFSIFCCYFCPSFRLLYYYFLFFTSKFDFFFLLLLLMNLFCLSWALRRLWSMSTNFIRRHFLKSSSHARTSVVRSLQLLNFYFGFPSPCPLTTVSWISCSRMWSWGVR